jgi:branched-chain amino acid transport system permease protein
VSEVAVKRIGWVALAALLLWLPQYLEGFWLQTGLFAMSSAIGAIGLTLLVGVTGQLSLANAFFIAIGAYGYSYLAGESGAPGGAITAPQGLGWPPWLAAQGHLPRPRLDRPGVHRPAHPAERDLGHRRLQRP